MKQKRNKLSLRKEVILQLGRGDMQQLAGGEGTVKRTANIPCVVVNTQHGVCETLPCVDISLTQLC